MVFVFCYSTYRSGELTPSDVAENVIRAIHDSEEQDPKLRAIVQWNEDEIRQVRHLMRSSKMSLNSKKT